MVYNVENVFTLLRSTTKNSAPHITLAPLFDNGYRHCRTT